jgi:hypothetical protein
VLTAFYTCGGCGEIADGEWPGEAAGDEQDRDGAPVADQVCPCGYVQTVEYPGWSLLGEAG